MISMPRFEQRGRRLSFRVTYIAGAGRFTGVGVTE